MTEAAFSALDPALPLALLPVRLEARYLPRRNPTHLHVRIFPDVIHADGHRTGLTERELAAGREYWTSVWGSADATTITEARRWLAGQTTPYRALWVSTTTRPTNLDSTDPAPSFPDVAADTATAPVRAELLPDEWMLRLYDGDLGLAHTIFSAPVAPDLAMAPTLSGAGTDAVHPTSGEELPAPLAFLAGQELLWTVDFGEAERVGMAVRIPIASVPEPVGALLVLGVRGGRSALEEAGRLDDLVAAHWYTRGFDALPQGTPTNSTDAGRSGVSLSSPDLDELFEREASERPIAPAGRALLLAADPAMLYRIPAADAASLAFGRVRANPLDRVVHADWAEGAAAWAMSVAIGHGTVGRFLRTPFAKVDGSVAMGDESATFREWFVDWVRGGSLLPVLRCGEQPYGLLPITHRPTEHRGALEFDLRYEHHVTELLSTWREALPLAALDPDATDSRPGGSDAADATVIAEVLGAVPHPIALQLRPATNHVPEDTARLYELMEQIEAAAHQDNMSDPDYVTNGTDSLINRFWDDRRPYIFGEPDAHPPVPPYGISTQLANVDFFRQDLEHAIDVEDRLTTGPDILRVLDEVQPLLEMYRDAGLAVPPSLWDWYDGGGLGSGDVIRLVGTTFDEVAEPVGDLVTTDAGLDGLRATIEAVIARLEEIRTASTPPNARPPLLTSPAPLLAHLLDANHRTVEVADIGPVLVGLRVLLALIDSPLVPAPADQLERLMRESLGLAIYRIDAWVTALAAKRLAERRRHQPAGLQIGGYGWLLDLRPSDDPTTQGFVHAPSLSHAATAAVLRSGWSAYATAGAEVPLAVDLSSDRVRGGQWILDGVRNGQDLAELLGARFERYLHDAHLDDWIAPVRELALVARGRPGAAPRAVVDGVLVARAASDVTDLTDDETALAEALDVALGPVADPQEKARRQGVRRALRRLAADLDCVADLTMAQTVHSLLQDNPEAASAALAVTGGRDGAVPPIGVTATQRDARLVGHRVAALWPTGAAEAGTGSALQAAEPRLVPWLRRLLPGPAEVVAEVTVRDEGGDVAARETTTLASLGLTSVEAAMLAGRAPSQAVAPLGRALAAAMVERYGGLGDVTLDLTGSAVLDDETVSVDEFGLLASAMLDGVGRGRALRAEDLLPAGSEVTSASTDLAELEARVAAVETVLLDLLTALDTVDHATRAQALARCAAIGVPGAMVALERGAPDEETFVVVAALKERLEPDDQAPTAASGASARPGPDLPDKPGPVKPRPVKPGPDEPGPVKPGPVKPGPDKPGPVEPPPPPPDPVQLALDRLTRLTGAKLPLLPVFRPEPDADRAASARSTLRRRQVEDDGHRWLRQSARVRPDLGRMTDFLLLAEAATGAVTAPYGLAQLPETGGPWGAIDQPSGEGDRLSILSLTGPDALAAESEPLAGLLVDGWTEGIPRARQQTGVAVHFDAPTARPPQAVLLSVVDDERAFSADDLADQLLHTIELAKLRAVGPVDLQGVGQYLPAVFLDDEVVISGGAA